MSISTELKNIKIIKKIANGAFGEIFHAHDMESDRPVAVKLEKKAQGAQLKHEYSVYRILASNTVPRVYGYGKILYNNVYMNGMVMQLLGKSLEQVFNDCNRKLSLKSVLMIAERMIDCVEYMHHKNYVHRDIKPDNFVFDTNYKNLYLIDYGLAKEFRNPSTFKHRELRTDKSLTGTARYASLRTHQGYEQSRRDDLESLGFCVIYFLKGRLPWQGLKADTKQAKYDKIKEYKEGVSIFELCMDLPQEIHSYMFYVRNLGYEDMPNYSYLKSLISDCRRKRGIKNDGLYEWSNEKNESIQI